jgi:Holliday junction DNA helicase RuvB
LHGPPGLGKTTLANIIANELSVGFKISSGPVLDKPGDLAGLFNKATKERCPFIDEIHRLNPLVEEYLYSAMEDYRIDILIDKGPAARSVQIPLEPFTLIGATTRSGLLTSPLRARFGINCHLNYYTSEILKKIIIRAARILNVPIDEEAAWRDCSSQSWNTQNIECFITSRKRFRSSCRLRAIDLNIAKPLPGSIEYRDNTDWTRMDNKILPTIVEKFSGGPVGLKTIATAVGEDEGTIEEVYEPFLIMEGFIKRTPRGREATEKAYFHVNKKQFRFSTKTILMFKEVIKR